LGAPDRSYWYPAPHMSPRLSILAGLLVGVAVAALVLGGIYTLAPDPVPVATPVPSTAVDSPSAPAGASASPSAGPAGPASSDSLSAGPSGSPGGAFHIGEPAPALVVPQVGGGTIDLSVLHGQPVWVNFMATWCPPCQDEFPLMAGFAARYADQGLVVVAIDAREEEGAAAAFADRFGATFPMGLDPDGSASARWGALALPVHFWIDADGIVRDGALGGIGPDTMVAGLRTILPGVDVQS
jgi:cytochrome c biogenesis protein CcmG/thiol:disulfide interchange protein DsbE